MVFCGLFPTEADQYPDLRDALDKLQLSDAALKYEPETSSPWASASAAFPRAAAHGDRAGTARARVRPRSDRHRTVGDLQGEPDRWQRGNDRQPGDAADPQKRESIEEPYVKMEIYAPNEYNGALMGLYQERRSEYIDMKYITTDRVTLIYELPLAEVVTDFFDQMKTRTRGYASMEYSLIGYRKNQLVRLDVLINGDQADALTTIVHQDKAYNVGKALVEKLKELIPRQQFKIPIQAIGSRIIASTSISAIRKDVLAKCYGGDIFAEEETAEEAGQGQEADEGHGQGGCAARRPLWRC